MRRDGLYLTDIVVACEDIAGFVAGVEHDSFISDKMRASAVLQKLTVVGEAISRLSPNLKNSYQDIEWSDITALRNRIVHGYFNIDYELIWIAAMDECPGLKQQVQAILNSDQSLS